jgi:preprotein translocase subunit YajC
VEFNSETPVNYTISLGALNLLQIGDTVHVCQAGDGKVTVVADEGVTVKKGDSFNRATMERDAIIVLVKTAEGVARLGGSLEAVA